MSMKKICFASVVACVVAAAPTAAQVVPITSIEVTTVGDPSGTPEFLLESITVGGFTVVVEQLVTGTSTGAATAQPAPYNVITAADNFDLNLFAGRADETPPTWQITDLGGQAAWTDTNGDNPDFFLFETGGNQDFSIEAILPGGTLGRSVNVPQSAFGATGLNITTSGPHDGQTIEGVAFAITDLPDADGNPLTNDSTIEGIQVTSAGIDPSCFCAVAGEPILKALRPDPADGATAVEVPLLQWLAGQGATSQKVYASADAEITEDDVVAPMLPTAMTLHPLFGSPLFVPGVTIYWRVDSIQADGSVVEGDVWTFSTPPAAAWAPSPAPGSEFVIPDAGLTWRKGFGAITHDVYLGTDADAVTTGAADAFQGKVFETSFDTGLLDNETTYYWRIDEIDAAGTVTPGEVWSFTTLPVIAIVDPNLIGFWKFDGTSDTIAVDFSGYGNHGELRGGPQRAPGYAGKALDLDGVDDFVFTGKSAADLGIEGAKPKSVTAWVFTRAFNNGGIFDLGARSDGQDFCLRTLGGTNNWRVQYWGGAFDHDFSFPSQGVWVHFALVYTGTVSTAYANGVAISSEGRVLDTSTSNPFQIGVYGWQNDFFNGVIDEVRLYDKALTEDEILVALRADPLRARNPDPSDGATTDALAASPLRWQPGDTAVQHDVYLTTDPNAIADANSSDATGVYRGRQAATRYTPVPPLEWGQDYFWRIDEVDAQETITPGRVWTFSLTDYIIVDDFEDYGNDVGSRPFEFWIDGIGFTQPPPGNPGNGTGAAVGHDIFAVGTTFGEWMETSNVHGGGQALPVYFTGLSEATRTFIPPQNWAADGITTLVLFVAEDPDNTDGSLYIKINSEKVPLVDNGTYPPGFDPGYVQYNIDLTGMNVSSVRSLTIGVEGATAQGLLLVDDIRLYRVAPEPVVLTLTGPIIEAESGDLTAPFEVLSDIPGASGGQYIMVPNGSGSSGGAPAAADDGWAVYTIDIPADGDYVIALLGLNDVAGDGGDDSFWVSMPTAVLGHVPFTPPRLDPLRRRFPPR